MQKVRENVLCLGISHLMLVVLHTPLNNQIDFQGDPFSLYQRRLLSQGDKLCGIYIGYLTLSRLAKSIERRAVVHHLADIQLKDTNRWMIPSQTSQL